MRGMHGAFVLVSLAAALTACGGGGGSSGSNGSNGGGTTTPTPAAPLTITTASPLPAGLQGHAYSTPLTAVNGQGALHWSIAISTNQPFVPGLSIDPNTGVVSGTPTFAGTGVFIATVTDSASPAQSASSKFNVNAYPPLTSAQSQTASVAEFQAPTIVQTALTGGLPPVSFAVTSGTIAPGLRVANGQIIGTPYQTGTYQFMITAEDSFSPPETATQPFTITVTAPRLTVASTIPSRLILNRPFSGRIIAMGGTPPYSFSRFDFLPAGLSFDTSTGVLSGTPTTVAQYFTYPSVTDSSTPPQSAMGSVNFQITPAHGRNDSPATATQIDNGSYSASISPYIDPPNGTPAAGDNDYYKLISLGGATVHVETNAKRFDSSNPLDTVIEIVDGNGLRLNTCRQPGDTSTTFSSSCINDDISVSPHVQDSALDFQVPGPGNATSAFYVHVFDWRGDARPDMVYSLVVSGVADPLAINPVSLPGGARGLSYGSGLSTRNGSGTITLSVVSGSLPPGLTLSPSGAITGVPTTDGAYPFTVQASDSGNPPQVVSVQKQIVVAEPLQITSSPAWPDACLNQPYSFTVQTSGGVPPLNYLLQGLTFLSVDQTTGTFSGTPTAAGSFGAGLFISDATLRTVSQSVTLAVKPCP